MPLYFAQNQPNHTLDYKGYLELERSYYELLPGMLSQLDHSKAQWHLGKRTERFPLQREQNIKMSL